MIGCGMSLFRKKKKQELSNLDRLLAMKDPFVTWMTRVTAADLDYQDACGKVDPADLQALVDKRFLHYAAYQAKKTK